MQDRLRRLPIVVALDFDNVLHQRDEHDWSLLNRPFLGAKEGCIRLKALGCALVIHSCRVTDRIVDGEFSCSQYKDIESWLNIHGIPFDVIWNAPGKPFAHIYVDDRGFRFSSWEIDLDALSSIVQSYKDMIG
jgi:hypothetical protein